MKSKVLLLLFLIIQTGVNAQTSHVINPLTAEYEFVSVGDIVEISQTGGITPYVECYAAPGGVDKTKYSNGVLLSLGYFWREEMTIPGKYYFEYTTTLSGYNAFIIEVVDGTLSSNIVKKSSNISVFYHNGIVNVTNETSDKITSVSIINVSGSVVYTSKKEISAIDVSSFASGVYILMVEQKGDIITRKFIKN